VAAINGGRSVGTLTYILPSEWNAMTSERCQAYLQTRAASRIQAITTAMNDDVSAITNPTQGQNTGAQQVATAQTVGAGVPSVITPASNAPFGGRAAHTGRGG
jgi:hypothetical protein